MKPCPGPGPGPGLGGAWMGVVVALPLDIVDNFIILTVSVVFLINYISDISKL